MSLLDLRRRIVSVKNTQKITRAMEMVAASKMKKAQDSALAGRPYSVELEKLIRNLAAAGKIEHPLFARREVKKILFILFTGDRGLCGSFNSGIIRYLARRELGKNQEKAIVAVGRKGMQFFKSVGENVVAEFEGLADKPSLLATTPITKIAEDAFLSGDFDEVRLVYNHFENTMSQVVTEKRLLPFSLDDVEEGEISADEYAFEPDAKTVFDRVLPRYLETIVYQTLLESNASEQSARMVAMKSASENAGELIDGLTLDMNKARQASITTELSEIVSGAAALE